MDENGEACPKIIDFGVAKAIDIELTEQTFFTLFGRIVGTPEYMSPEQTGLNAVDVDTRSDIYSLGVVLYELLAGCVPLPRKQLIEHGFDDMRRMIREKEPLKPSSGFAALDEAPRTKIAEKRQTEPIRLERRLQSDLDWIVMKAIEKDRTRRYDTAKGLASDVDRYLKGLPVQAGPPSRSYRVGKFVRRNRVGVLIAGITVIALIGGIIATSMALRSQRQKNREILFQNRKILVESARAGRLSGVSGWLDKSLGNIQKASKIRIDEDLRNEALACLAGTDMQQTETGFAIQNSLAPIAFDFGHQYCAVVQDQGRISILDRSGYQLISTVISSLPLDDCRLSFGGINSAYLIIATSPSANSLMEVIEWETGKTVIPPTRLSYHAFDLLPSQKGIVIGSPDNTLVFLKWNGEAFQPPVSLPGRPRSISLCPETNQVAVGLENQSGVSSNGRMLIFDNRSRELIDEYRGFDAICLAWNPSGRFLAMGDDEGTLSIYEPGVRKSINQTVGHVAEIKQIAWSRDGRLLASASADWAIQLWDGRHGSRLSTHKARAGNFSFSPDDKHLGPVAWDRKIFALGIQHSKVCHRAVGHTGGGGITASAWDSISGKLGSFSLTLATAGSDAVILWNRHGAELARFEDVTDPKGLAFSSSWFYIAGKEGVLRRKRSVRPNPKGQLEISFGPSEVFAKLEDCGQLALTPDESLLVIASGSGVWLADTKGTSRRKLSGTTTSTFLAIDSGGKWLATTESKVPSGVQIWKLPEGNLIPNKRLTAAKAATLAFSPVLGDGRILLATGDSSSYHFWNPMDGWKEVEELKIDNHMADIPGRMVFSPRGTAFAISHERDLLKVLNPRTVPMEDLIQPNFDQQWPLAISRDGILISTEGDRGRLFIWDLMAVRAEFVNLGIDWTTMETFPEADIPIVTSAHVE
jgi:WD40 repeat protein